MSDKDITVMLQDWVAGDLSSLGELTPLVYDHLHHLAANIFSQESPDHTLQTTALVHEAFAKLTDVNVNWQDRRHFYAIASKTMRRILVDHARAKSALKRGSRIKPLPLENVIAISSEIGDEIINLHEALSKLMEKDADKSNLLELHYFGGLSYQEIVDLLDISSSKLDRDMRFAKAWLRDYLDES